MVQLTLNISGATVEELDVKRLGDGEIRFDVGRVVTNVDFEFYSRLSLEDALVKAVPNGITTEGR